MSQQIKDLDVRRLASIASLLQSDYEENEDWIGSPFAWIKTRPSRQVGKIGEQLVSGWCAAKGLSVGPSGDTEADKVIQGRRVEIKFSTLWKSGVYNFQQIRDQDYDFLICLGLSPFDARCWVIPKKALYDYVIGHTPQHTGAGGTDTFWLLFPANNSPIWLESYGGKLSQAFQILSDL